MLIRDLPPEYYVLGPWYGGKHGNDFQIVVTGKTIVNEPYEKAMYRELGEEIRLVPKFDARQHRYKFDDRTLLTKGNVRKSITTINVRNLKPITVERPPRPGRDERNRRVNVVVYGTKEDVVEAMAQADSSWGASDYIKGLVAVPVKMAMNILGERRAN